jgi:hypothetical protein
VQVWHNLIDSGTIATNAAAQNQAAFASCITRNSDSPGLLNCLAVNFNCGGVTLFKGFDPTFAITEANRIHDCRLKIP